MVVAAAAEGVGLRGFVAPYLGWSCWRHGYLLSERVDRSGGSEAIKIVVVVVVGLVVGSWVWILSDVGSVVVSVGVADDDVVVVVVMLSLFVTSHYSHCMHPSPIITLPPTSPLREITSNQLLPSSPPPLLSQLTSTPITRQLSSHWIHPIAPRKAHSM